MTRNSAAARKWQGERYPHMKVYNFNKLKFKSFIIKKLGVRAEFHQVSGIIFLRVTDIDTGIELRDEFASAREIDYLLEQNGI